MPILMGTGLVVEVTGLVGTQLLESHIHRIQDDEARIAEDERLRPLSYLLWAGIIIGVLLFVAIFVGEGIISNISDVERDAWDGCGPGRC
ncbi:MAG: hypothetical protein O2783_02305 [Chloroflexi bacterium]|nr:hypothetical protein [Chloroflexota bacterium]